MWLSIGLHRMWCEGGHCYSVSEEYVCKFCGIARVEKYHLLWCDCVSELFVGDSI